MYAKYVAYLAVLIWAGTNNVKCNEDFADEDDFFSSFNPVDGEINEAAFKDGLNSLPIFKYLRENNVKRGAILQKFRGGASPDGKMNQEQFLNTFNLKYILTEILPSGVTEYNRALLKELFEFQDDQLNRLMLTNNRETVSVDELAANNGLFN